jgi:hypothetical protein
MGAERKDVAVSIAMNQVMEGGDVGHPMTLCE